MINKKIEQKPRTYQQAYYDKKNESKYCQSPNCKDKGKEQENMHEFAFDKKVAYSSKKSDRKVIIEYIMLCDDCFRKKLDKK